MVQTIELGSRTADAHPRHKYRKNRGVRAGNNCSDIIYELPMWEGRLTTRHLCDVFGIGRQQASKDINNYKRSIGPGNLEYEAIAKGYRPSSDFAPRVSRGEAEEYLEIVAGLSDMQQLLGQLPHAFLNTEVLTAPRRHIPPTILRPLLHAARDHRRIE